MGADQEPTHTKSLNLARSLRITPKTASWRNSVMRYLVELVNKEVLTLGMTGRTLSALALSRDPGAAHFFRQMLNSNQPNLRQLAALACGMIFDSKSIDQLASLFNDDDPIIGGTACLALVAIGTKVSLDMVMGLLLQGSETMRQVAAEALANNVEVGHEALEEGSGMPDLLVRRSVVYALKRIRSPWAIQALEKMEIEDGQWVVRTAATQALEDLRRPNPHIPKPLPELTESPWLVEFAAKQGMGVTPGQPALDLVMRALETGESKERIHALEYFRLSGNEDYFPQLYSTYYGSQATIHEIAFNTLWHFAASGVILPPPIQYGLG